MKPQVVDGIVVLILSVPCFILFMLTGGWFASFVFVSGVILGQFRQALYEVAKDAYRSSKDIN